MERRIRIVVDGGPCRSIVASERFIEAERLIARIESVRDEWRRRWR